MRENKFRVSSVFLVFKLLENSPYPCYFRLDYCGIAFLEMGSFVPYLYYSFYCRLGVKITYVALIIVLGTLCLVVSLWDKFSEPRFRGLRAGKCVDFHSQITIKLLNIWTTKKVAVITLNFKQSGSTVE